MISPMRKPPRKRTRRAATASAVVSSLLETAEAVETRLEAAVSPLGLSLAKLGVLHPLAEAREPLPLSERSEERRVGEVCGLGRVRDDEHRQLGLPPGR